MSTHNASASLRFSTDGLPQAARAKAVRDLCERTSLPGKIEPLEPLPDCAIRVDVTKRALPGLGVLFGTLCGVRQVVRSKGSVSSGEDDLLVGVNLRGRSAAHYRDRELILDEGDAFVATRDLIGFSIARATPMRFMGLRVPRDAIAPLIGRLDDGMVRVVPHGAEALNLLVTYAGAIANLESVEISELQRLIVTHIQDLVAATVGATRDGLAIAEGRGIRAARLRAIMADVAANLGDGDLTVAAIASRQRVTPRYVHKLFEGDGLTFSAFVLGRRLAHAHRMLSDPNRGHRSIGSVAFEVGFGDLSYFNRTFRRCCGATPSEVRQSAARNRSPH